MNLSRGKLAAVGLLLGFLAFGVAAWVHEEFFDEEDEGGMEFLQEEFHLDAEACRKIGALEKDHQEKTAGLARDLKEKSDRFTQKLISGKSSNQEIESLRVEMTKVRNQSQQILLEHLRRVSLLMSPEQGRRYLKWMAHRFTEDPEIQEPSDNER